MKRGTFGPRPLQNDLTSSIIPKADDVEASGVSLENSAVGAAYDGETSRKSDYYARGAV